MRQQLNGTVAGRLPGPLRKLIGAGETMHKLLADGATAPKIVLAMFDWLCNTSGYVGLFLRSSNGSLKARPPGLAVKDLFPLPWLSHSTMSGGTRRTRVMCRAFVNIWLAFLNAAYLGTSSWQLCQFAPSIAQLRVHRSLWQRAVDFASELSTEMVFGGEQQINGYLHMASDNAYEAHLPVLPLGVRGGLPSQAATVNTAEVLAADYPDLSALCLEPRHLLKEDLHFDDKPPRRFAFLAPTYDEFVRKAVEVGLQDLREEADLHKVDGELVWSGAFAVPKDAEVDRVISPLEMVNQLVCERKMKGVVYPYLPQLSTMWVEPSVKLLVSKRDASNYYPSLACGEKWSSLFAMPPVHRGGRTLYPCHLTWPMGFRGSCSIAQAVTYVVTARAGLLQSCRLLPTLHVPLRPPVWASLLDDVWSLVTDEGSDMNSQARLWLPRVDSEWLNIGVTTHPKKRVDHKENEEIQGARVHSTKHLVGLSAVKSMELIIGCLWVCSQYRPSRRAVERVVGKLGFAHLFRSANRGSFGCIYGRLQTAREERVMRINLGCACWWELIEAVTLLPLSQMCLSAPFSPTVQCTDAAPGGHGIAYTLVGSEECQRWTRYCSFRGCRTTLQDDLDLRPDLEDVCPLVVAQLPLHQYRWVEVGRPGGFRHIAIEEFEAQNWGLERRIARGETGVRCLEGGDNTTATAAAIKGRSSSWNIHRLCRKRMSLCLCADIA